MRASYAALVLATVAITHVAAGPVRHGHAHLHAKKDVAAAAAELKVEEIVKERDVDWADVDWAAVSYTYSSDQSWGQATPVPAPPAPAAAAAPAPAPAQPTTSAVPAAPAAAAAPAVADAATEAAGILTPEDEAFLTSLGALVGKNSRDKADSTYIGDDGLYVDVITNGAEKSFILMAWDAQGSWVNSIEPAISLSLAPNESIEISFSSGAVGAIAAVFEDTKMVNGQIQATWREHCFDENGVVDVSREVFTQGREISTTTAIGCTSNFDACWFGCLEAGVESCEFDYALNKCAPDSQPGAQYGLFDGNPSGGCGVGDGGRSYTTFY